MSDLFHDDADTPVVGYAQVAVEQGVDTEGGLTYAVPESLSDLEVGERVVVPLGRGNKATSGYVIELTDRCEFEKVKPILKRDASRIAVPGDLVELAKWMASYYAAPLGMVLTTMLPAAVKRGTGTISQVMVSFADPAPEGVKLTKLQQKVRDAATELAEAGEPWVESKRLADEAGARSVSSVKQLVTKGVLITKQQQAVRAALDEMTVEGDVSAQAMDLTGDQAAALGTMTGALGQGFSAHLLHGVTGSGKTEVYLRLIETALEAVGDTDRDGTGEPHRNSRTRSGGLSGGGGAIVLVPEIALTPQTVARFVGRFDEVAVLHSGLTASQRHEQWRKVHTGEAKVVIGARSAIFAPMRPSVIIVDEEHDTSYKQDQVPRYHARDVAIRRAHLLGIPVVLGSATPSLESYLNAAGFEPAPRGDDEAGMPQVKLEPIPPRRDWHLHRLRTRVLDLAMPKVRIVDLQEERRKRYEYTGSAGVHLLSIALEQQLKSTLAAGGQAMILLNRRGYANYIACPDRGCGWVMNCDYCDAMMVYHKHRDLPKGGVVRCHHCEAEVLLPEKCPQCETKRITVFGLGTQRVEEELERKMPNARVLRMDSDVMRRGRDYHETLQRFRLGEVDVLLGTQMIAKGLDFPNVRLVGVISADTALNMPDFRASERTFQLVAQVAGRAGRSDAAGRVLVQTFNPHDPAINAAAKHDYETFAQRELATRAATRLPPVGRLARIVIRHRDHVKCVELARKLGQDITEVTRHLGREVKMRGPMAAPIARIADFHRQQIELLAPPPSPAVALQELLTALRNTRRLHADAHTGIDVDPVALL